MGSIHVCTPCCHFERRGDVYTCSVSGQTHVCDSSCKHICFGDRGRFCSLTRRCHDALPSPERKGRATSSGNGVNQKDRFYNNARNVIYCIAQTPLEDALADRIASTCLSIYSKMTNHRDACTKIHSLNHEYLTLAFLYMMNEGIKSDGVQVVPKLDELEPILPNKCDIHKCNYDGKQRMSKKLRKGGSKPIGVRKRTLTTTSRHVREALRIWLKS